MRLGALLPILLAVALASSPVRAAALTWEAWEAAGARIGEIRIVAADVFDLARRDENHLVGKAANFIHVTTREEVVRAALLFGAGEPVRAAVIHESERRLRALPWMLDASIEPAPAAGGAVDAVVRTHDGWSLSLGLKFNHAGGDATWAVWLDERNVLGLGKEILVSRERDLDRSTTEFAYRDPMLFGSEWRLEAAYQDLSDGRGRRFLLARPFVQLATPWSAGIAVADRDERERLYNHGAEVAHFPAKRDNVRAYASFLLRLRNRTAWRAGLEYRAEEASYGPLTIVRPDDLRLPALEERSLRGLLATLAVSQDRYRTFTNLQSIGATEDVNLGWDAFAAAGWLGTPFGVSAEAFHAEFFARTGVAAGEKTLLFASASARGRREEGGWRDALARGRLSLFHTGLSWHTLAADFELAAGHRLDPEEVLYLGGFEGLRGYPNHFRAGEKRWTVTLEDRVITPWRLFGIAQVGFVVYAEAGAMDAPAGGWTRTFMDVGAGLRFGNLKGTVARVVQLTLSVPLVSEPGLDSFQVVAGNTLRF